MNGYNIALLRLILCLNMLPESERVCPGICRLDRTGRFGPYAGLDQLAFVGFEDEPFIDDIVQLSAFDALAEDEEEADVEECGQGDDK